MIFNKRTGITGIRICIALLCIMVLVMTVSASTARTAPANVQPAVVNVSPQVTLVVQPVTERIVVVTTTPLPQRVAVVTTVTTIPVVSEPRVIPVIATVTPRTAQQTRAVNATLTNAGTATGQKIVSVDKKRIDTVDPQIAKEELVVVATGVRDPKTGNIIPVDKSSGLPGGVSGKMPSAEDQWNNRFGESWTGDVTEGTPFDDNPLSNPMDDFLSEHGGNLPDPNEAFGKGRSVISSAEGGDQSGGDYSYMICGSDFLSVESQKSGKDECIIIEVVGGEITKESWSDFKELSEVWDDSSSGSGSGTQGQQYEGEGGYVGGTGGSANDLTFGGARRGMGGSGSGGTGTDDDGLAYDTGGKVPVVLQKVGEYVAKGGKLRSKGGYQPGDSGQGQDIGGTAEGRVSGLKKALAAQRFIMDPDATYAEQVPWWLEKKVSPMEAAAAPQASAVQNAGAGNAAAEKVT